MSEFQLSSQRSYGDRPFFIFADHASNWVPTSMNNLGLPDDILETHIAWDIGAGELTHQLGKRLLGRVFTCEFSRLVIDSNRDPAVTDSIPPISDQIPIPGNQQLSEIDRQTRVTKYFDVYHQQLNQAIEDVSTLPGSFVISVHSFTRRMMGEFEDRPWDAGLLWREDESSAQAMIRWLNENSKWKIGDNQPYDARVFNYSVDRHIGPRGLRHLTLEIRQDHLSTTLAIQQAADTLAKGIQTISN